ncbi:TrmB family transcriptional regulator [Acidobacteriota bacterium]
MEKKEIVQAIENLGLSTYEAKAYFALLSEAPLNGYKLSKNSGVPRSRIYETIEKLTAKGLVLSQEGNTTLLIPVSLESFLEKKEKESKRNINFLKEILPQLKKPAETQGIWTISGRDQIFESVNYFIAQAKSHVYLVSSDSDIMFFESALSEAEKRQISIFGAYCGEKDFKLKNLYPHQGQPCSSCRDISLTIDSEQALVGCTFPPDGAKVAVTKNPGIIHVAEEYIKHEIFLSKLFKNYDRVPSDDMNSIYQKIMGNLP